MLDDECVDEDVDVCLVLEKMLDDECVEEVVDVDFEVLEDEVGLDWLATVDFEILAEE